MFVIALKQLPADTPPTIALALQGITFYEGEDGFKESLDRQVQFLLEFKSSHGLKINQVYRQEQRPETREETEETETEKEVS